VPVIADVTGMRAGETEPFLQTQDNERYPEISPDGRWLAYTSSEPGTTRGLRPRVSG
jgi:hypothetical protein